MTHMTFEELSAPQGGMPSLCPGLPSGHPICSGAFPGIGMPTPPPLSPVPEPAQWVTLAAGLVAIAIYRRCVR